MNKFQKLAQLNRDIELLENAGKIKSAEVLHKKFLKEAQTLEPARNSDQYKNVFDRYFLSARTIPSQSLINTIRSDGFLFEEDQDKLADYITDMINYKAPKSPTANPTAIPTAIPVSTQSTSNSGDGVTVNKGNIIYSEDTANQNAKELSAEEMKKRIQYYEGKINEYNNLNNDPIKKNKMLLYLSSYMKKNYKDGKLDPNSYSRLMNDLGEESGIS